MKRLFASIMIRMVTCAIAFPPIVVSDPTYP